MFNIDESKLDSEQIEHLHKWIQSWQSQDYSWAGLAKIKLHGWRVAKNKAAYTQYIKQHGLPEGAPHTDCALIPETPIDQLPHDLKTVRATLQDYWRDQQSELITEPGGVRKWLPIHMPQILANGTRTWKNDVSAPEWDDLEAVMAQRLDCAVHTTCEEVNSFARFKQGRDGRANFRGAIIRSIPLKPYIESENPVHFNAFQSAFIGPQRFRNLTITSCMSFSKALFFGGYCSFLKTRFQGETTTFLRATFLNGNALFKEVDVSGQFTNFSKIYFGGDALFDYSKFRSDRLNFLNCNFRGSTSFFLTEFYSQYLSFIASKFRGGIVSFRGSKFYGASVGFNHVNFDVAMEVTLNDAVFACENLSFTGAKFTTRAGFSGVKFKQFVDFTGVRFQDDVRFDCAEFSEDAFYTHEVFRGAVFKQSADFSGVINMPYNAIGDGQFQGGVILDDMGEQAAKADFTRAFNGVKKSCDTAMHNDHFEDSIENRFGALERGFITLKLVMERSLDKNRAQRYFKYELLSRQARPSTGRVSKILTAMYGHCSGYGGSVSRPLVGLLLLWLICAILYGGHYCYFNGDGPAVSGALDFSATQMFRPFSIWSDGRMGEASPWALGYKELLWPSGWLTIKLLATLQSFASITLIFLFGLAVKRRYQIK